MRERRAALMTSSKPPPPEVATSALLKASAHTGKGNVSTNRDVIAARAPGAKKFVSAAALARWR